MRIASVFRAACGEARSAASLQLASLGRDLKSFSPQLTAIAHFSMIATMLTLHVDEALRRGWTIPEVSRFVQKQPGEAQLPSYSHALPESTVDSFIDSCRSHPLGRILALLVAEGFSYHCSE